MSFRSLRLLPTGSLSLLIAAFLIESLMATRVARGRPSGILWSRSLAVHPFLLSLCASSFYVNSSPWPPPPCLLTTTKVFHGKLSLAIDISPSMFYFSTWTEAFSCFTSRFAKKRRRPRMTDELFDRTLCNLLKHRSRLALKLNRSDEGK